MVDSYSSESAGDGVEATRFYQFESNLCHVGMRPLYLTGFFRDMLVRHFSKDTHIEHTSLRGLVWHPEDNTTKIAIESKHRWTPQLTEHRPAILIGRNSYSDQDLGIGQILRQPDGKGITHYANLVVGSHTLFCLHHSSGAAAEILATEVYREIKHFAPVFRRTLGLIRMRIHQVGAVSRLEESEKTYVVPITVGWAYMDEWVVEQEALPLTKIALQIITDG